MSKIRKNITLDKESLRILESASKTQGQSHSAFIRHLLWDCRDYAKVLFQGGSSEVYFESGDERVVVIKVMNRSDLVDFSVMEPAESSKGTPFAIKYASLDKAVHASFGKSLYGYRLKRLIVISPEGFLWHASLPEQAAGAFSLVGDGDLLIVESEFPMPQKGMHGAWSVLRYESGKIDLVSYQLHSNYS